MEIRTVCAARNFRTVGLFVNREVYLLCEREGIRIKHEDANLNLLDAMNSMKQD